MSLVVPKQRHGVQRLSLSQILAMSEDKGPLPVKVEGWIQGTKRRLPDCPRCGKMAWFDETTQSHKCLHCGLDTGIEPGRVLEQFAQHNLVTRLFFQPYWFNDTDWSDGARIYISGDDTGVHELKTIMEDTVGGTSANIVPTIDTVLDRWTFTYTFGAPGTARVIRQIGLCKYAHYTQGQWRSSIASTATELSSPVTQTPADTFEVVYRLQFSEVV